MQPNKPIELEPPKNPSTLENKEVAQAPIVFVPGVTPMPDNSVVVQPNVLVQDVEKAATSIKQHYTSPAFWYHAFLQAMVWLSYFQTVSSTVKLGSIAASVAGFAAYLVHLMSK